jgi:malonyl CoA-acyl carrier protein transacylase
LLGAGVRDFVELGPGEVLCGLLKRIERSATCRAVAAAADLEVTPA